MPLCFLLENYSIASPSRIAIRASLHPGQVNLPNVLMACFPGLSVKIDDDDRLSGWSIVTGLWETDLVLEGRVPSTESLASFLELLKEPRITIADELDESHCLDFHQRPTEVPQEFTYTNIGRLVFQAKYRGNAAAADEIATQMGHFINRHPRYERAQCIAAVPRSTSVGWLNLAQRLIDHLTGFLAKHRLTLYRSEAVTSQKDVSDEAERYSRQQGTMACDHDLALQSVVIIDDMYGSGASMQEAARTLRAAGAAEVLGLAATKTLKYARGVSL